MASDGLIRSSLDIKPGGGWSGGRRLAAVLGQAESSAQAAGKLAHYRRLLHGQPALIAACDSVCGLELTPREASSGDREAGKLEAVLLVGLDILAAAAGSAQSLQGPAMCQSAARQESEPDVAPPRI